MEAHRLAEQRSLALHREVAAILRREPARVGEALERVRSWKRDGSVHPHYADAWERLLEGPLEALLAALVGDGQRARDLRQSSPFAGFVDPRTRWRIWREVRDRVEAS